MENIEGVQAVDPSDLEGKVLIVRTGARYLDTAVVLRELRKSFPQLQPHNVLILPDDLTLSVMGRQDALALLRNLFAMLGGA